MNPFQIFIRYNIEGKKGMNYEKWDVLNSHVEVQGNEHATMHRTEMDGIVALWVRCTVDSALGPTWTQTLTSTLAILEHAS